MSASFCSFQSLILEEHKAGFVLSNIIFLLSTHKFNLFNFRIQPLTALGFVFAQGISGPCYGSTDVAGMRDACYML